ncbi:MAG: hypothetical protein ACSHYB_02300 [Roseibacillus sp.]
MKAFSEHEASVKESWDVREASVAMVFSHSPAIFTESFSEGSIHGDFPTLIGSPILSVLIHTDEVETAAVIVVGTSVPWEMLAVGD